MNRYIKNNQIFEMYVHAKSKMKRETGANPVRSRHCKRESVIIMSLQKLWEDEKRCRNISAAGISGALVGRTGSV